MPAGCRVDLADDAEAGLIGRPQSWAPKTSRYAPAGLGVDSEFDVIHTTVR